MCTFFSLRDVPSTRTRTLYVRCKVRRTIRLRYSSKLMVFYGKKTIVKLLRALCRGVYDLVNGILCRSAALLGNKWYHTRGWYQDQPDGFMDGTAASYELSYEYERTQSLQQSCVRVSGTIYSYIWSVFPPLVRSKGTYLLRTSAV